MSNKEEKKNLRKGRILVKKGNKAMGSVKRNIETELKKLKEHFDTNYRN